MNRIVISGTSRVFGNPVLANVVAQHSREIGIRLALGATPTAVTWMVVRRGLILMVSGMSIGMAGAFAVTRLMTGML